MALDPDAPAKAAGGTVSPDGGNASPVPPAPDTDVVVVQDGDDEDGCFASVQELLTNLLGGTDREDLCHVPTI
jgi:hypothetical protein